ncbi:MAG TPA: 30S ribosomal protein S9 [Patescibacteria group bacterium]|nr:30S ribosomal protein S9 [Patescibacteria group bacterium]
MARKSTTKKEQKKVTKKSPEASEAIFEGKYFFAVGRRKSAVAQVRLYPQDDAKKQRMIINQRSLEDYFPILVMQSLVLMPLRISGMEGKFSFSVLVKGGGFHGQADAVKLGIARALAVYDQALRPSLKSAGLLTRDARVVERKKPGLKKARRAPQWAKR